MPDRPDAGAWRGLLDLFPSGLAIMDPAGAVLFSNSAFDRIYGSADIVVRSERDFIQFQTWWAKSGRPVKPNEWPAIRSMRSGKTVHGDLMRIRRFDGRKGFILSSASPLISESGVITGCVISARDVTDVIEGEELQRVQRVIEHSIPRSRSIETSLRKIADLVARVLDCSGVVIRIEDGAQRIDVRSGRLSRVRIQRARIPLGDGQRGELVVSGIPLPLNDVQHAQAKIQELAAAIGSALAERLAIVRLREEVAGRRVVERDLMRARRTLEKRVVERTRELSQSREQLIDRQRLFDQFAANVRDVFWLAAPDLSRMYYISPAYASVWGGSPAEVYRDPRRWARMVHPDDRVQLRGTMLSILRRKSGEALSSRYRIIRADGSVRWIADRGWAVRDASGKVIRIAGLARDVTEQHEMERKLIGAAEQERQRIARDLHDSLGQSLAGISYIANALVSTLEQSGSSQAVPGRRMLKLLGEVTRQSHELVEGLLPADIVRRGLVSALRDLALRVNNGSGLKCDYEGPRTLRILDAEQATQCYRIVQEAVHNAVRHSRADRLTIRVRASRRHAVIAVIDSGVGMRGGKAGRGLGLRTMSYRAELMGSSIRLETGRQGTTIAFRVPLANGV